MIEPATPATSGVLELSTSDERILAAGQPPVARVAALYVENADIGDGHFVSELAMTLREYADLLESGEAGRVACDRYHGPRGTVVTTIGSALNAEQVRRAAQGPAPMPGHIEERVVQVWVADSAVPEMTGAEMASLAMEAVDLGAHDA